MTELDTKTKILDTAEQLFAKHGFAATSLRTVIKEAGVNTASVHYHFGSREGLIEAAFLRRAEPINEQRLRDLDKLESSYPDRVVPVEKLVEAFLEPPVRLHYDRNSGDWLFPRLMSRALTEPDADLHGLLQKVFGEIILRFNTAFSRSLPSLSPHEIMWRMHFMIAALAFTIGVPAFQTTQARKEGGIEPDLGPLTDVDTILSRLVAFVSAGMRTPPPPRGGARAEEQG
jgi:AcrR family transcriptional regulator